MSPKERTVSTADDVVARSRLALLLFTLNTTAMAKTHITAPASRPTSRAVIPNTAPRAALEAGSRLWPCGYVRAYEDDDPG